MARSWIQMWRLHNMQSNLVEFLPSNTTKSTSISWIKMEQSFMVGCLIADKSFVSITFQSRCVCIVMQCGIVRCDDILWLSIVYILQYALIKVLMDDIFCIVLSAWIGSHVEVLFKHSDYWFVYEIDGPLQIQGRYWSNRMISGLKAFLEGVTSVWDSVCFVIRRNF